MSKQGFANFRFIPQLKPLKPPALGAVTQDYTVIKWWAEAMAKMSGMLADMRKFLKDNPAIDPDNHTFKALREKLAEDLKEVARHTKKEFGDPWGLVAMDQASGSKAKAKTLLMGPTLAIFRERD